MSAPIMTPAELAEHLDATPRYTRKFLRAITPREDQPGKGGRWAIDGSKKELSQLTKKFKEFQKADEEKRKAREERAAARAAKEAAKAKVKDIEPTSEELEAIEEELEN